MQQTFLIFHKSHRNSLNLNWNPIILFICDLYQFSSVFCCLVLFYPFHIFLFSSCLLFSSFSSGAGTKGSKRGEFHLALIKLGVHNLHNGAFSSSLFFLHSSDMFLCHSLMILSNYSLSLSFCLVLFQSSSEDQSECTGDESGTGVG